MKTLRITVMIVAVLGILKGAYMLAWPAGAQKLMDWWLDVPPLVLRVVGGVMAVAGLALLALTVVQIEEPVLVATMLMGALSLAAGIAYQYPSVWRTAVNPFTRSGRLWLMRLIALAVLAVAGLLLAAAL